MVAFFPANSDSCNWNSHFCLVSVHNPRMTEGMNLLRDSSGTDGIFDNAPRCLQKIAVLSWPIRIEIAAILQNKLHYIRRSSLLMGSIGGQPWTSTWLYFLAVLFASIQVAFFLASSSCTLRLQDCFRRPLLLKPWGFHSRAERVMLSSGFRSVCPIQFHFLLYDVVVSFPIVLHLKWPLANGYSGSSLNISW